MSLQSHQRLQTKFHKLTFRFHAGGAKGVPHQPIVNDNIRSHDVYSKIQYTHSWTSTLRPQIPKPKLRCADIESEAQLELVAGRATTKYGKKSATISTSPMKNFPRVSVDPAQMGGVACIRHLRIRVSTVLRLLAGSLANREIQSQYPDLQTEDIRECLSHAAATAVERGFTTPAINLKFLIDNSCRRNWLAPAV